MGLQPEDVVTTQRTSKLFKLMLLVGYLAMALAACPAAVAWIAVLNEWPMVSRDQQSLVSSYGRRSCAFASPWRGLP